MFTRGARRIVGVAAVGAILGLSGCASSDTAQDDEAATPSSTHLPLTAGAPSESELAPGWNEAGDGPSPSPDADLTSADLTALLRTRSSAANEQESCGPADVTARLSGTEAALGHRYTSLVVTNTSSQPCVVQGVPSVGARGDWGHRFTLIVETPTPAPGSAGPVRLMPDAEAWSLVEWTGELAGQGAERASLIVVQLASGQVPVPVPARITDVPDGQDELDLGMLSTMRLGPFEPRA